MSPPRTRPRRSGPRVAAVEQPFGLPRPRLHCPLCGQALTSERHYELVPTPCPHLAFIYTPDVADLVDSVEGTFIHSSPDFADRLATLAPRRLSLRSLPRFLTRAGYDHRLLVLALTYGGMACGPVWYTDVYAFDLLALTPTGRPRLDLE